MFTAADDAALGIPIETGLYPDGEEGIQKSLKTICNKIREGAPTAVMKSFAGNLMKENGFPEGARKQGAAALAHVRKNVLYAPDALGTEQIQSAKVTLCVEGAPICIPCGDCDDLVCALGTILAALGHEVRVVRQIFGGGHQQHVLVEVKDEYGAWFPLDPSSKTMPAGEKAPAQRETYHSPFDEAVDAKFVGIGRVAADALPVWVWKKNQWHRVGVGQALEQAVGVGDACCASCAGGGECDGKSKAVGFATYDEWWNALGRTAGIPYDPAGVGGIYCMHKGEAEMQEDGVWRHVGQNVEAFDRGMVRRKPGVGQITGDLQAQVKDLVIAQTDQAKAQIITETKNSVWTAGLIGGAIGAFVGVSVGAYLARKYKW